MNLPQHIRDHAVLGVFPINPAAIAFTGGSLNGVTIGLTTPAAGKFTTIQGTDTTDATDSTTGALKVAGGVGIAKKLFVGTTFQVGSGSTTNAGWIAGYQGSSGIAAWWLTSVTPSTTNYNISASSLATAINNATATNLQIGTVTKLGLTSGLTTSINPLSVTDATDSSSTTTGSLKTAGGLGVAKKAYFGDTVQIGTGNNTSAGLVMGYGQSSSYGGIWGTAAAATTSNYGLLTNTANTYINGSSSVNVAVNAAVKFTITATNITHIGDMIYDKTITAPGTTGAQTINKTTGRVNFAAAATSLVLTNSLITANSIIRCTVATNDTTMHSCKAVAAAGSATLYPNAAPTAETAVNFTVTN